MKPPKVDIAMEARIRSIRDMLFYTEGSGRSAADFNFWIPARARAIAEYPALVSEIRAKGGWRTEQELQVPWELI